MLVDQTEAMVGAVDCLANGDGMRLRLDRR